MDAVKNVASDALGLAKDAPKEIKRGAEEAHSEAHQILRQYVGNQRAPEDEPIPGIKHPGATGVIYCTDRAQANGFSQTDPEWANLGQGAPEVSRLAIPHQLEMLTLRVSPHPPSHVVRVSDDQVGDLPGGPPRPKVIDLTQWGEDINEYSPTVGVKELREAVAHLYNTEYRQGKESQYTYENVCIVPGGRAGMARVAAGDVYTGYQIPEYTTYSEVLSVFKRLVPIPTALDAKASSRIILPRHDFANNSADVVDLSRTSTSSTLIRRVEHRPMHRQAPDSPLTQLQLKKEISNLSLSVVVASNPRNPTGQCIAGEDLSDLVHLSRDKTTIILDEFYSWYQYPDDDKDLGYSLSGASYVEDVNEDPVVIINGLTKGFRLPGWRVCWVVGPKSAISAISQSGSFLDGGASHPLQMAAIPLLEPSRVQQDKVRPHLPYHSEIRDYLPLRRAAPFQISLQKAFRTKRDHVLSRLEKMGLPVTVAPTATFYIWLDLSPLEAPLNNGLVFFEELLKASGNCYRFHSDSGIGQRAG
ncbi:hypothetical protein EHS25_002480 [Saitozyma podzolica]|uniref:Aminotransferase class I/classII large domain-containing protein n=1 Tax=Saitozyma podzolica TaxID=1890683 RepID=A0A427YE48_9TREE|nr:hypothetical protein EHS25_002480 [Saitozyma podzolica]